MPDHTSNARAFKICPVCIESKPLSDFYLNKSGTYHAYCKECERARKRKAYAADPRSTEKERLKTRIRREGNRERERELSRTYYSRNPEARRRATAKAKATNPERTRAHSVVNNAVQSGQFPPVWTMVCEHCQEAQAAHWHHHKGYAKEVKLDVIALCTECHGKAHWLE